jgi:lactoylglutathione lyase
MTNLDHVGIYVWDLEASLKFYVDLFGWKEVKRFGSGEAKIAVLDIGGGLLEVVQRPGSPGKAPEGNWSHLALHVDGWGKKVKKLESMGLELRKVTMADGSHIAFFKDPDGHTIEIMEKELSF